MSAPAVNWWTDPAWAQRVVWGDRVFLSGADASSREIFCWDAGTGRRAWRIRVEPAEDAQASPPRVTRDTGYAASTMAVNGKAAFAVFALFWFRPPASQLSKSPIESGRATTACLLPM